MRISLFCLVIAASAAVPLQAGQDFVCPKNLTVTETVQNLPKGWRLGHEEGPHWLYYVSMSYADGYDSMADYEKPLRGERTKYTWDLNAVVKKEPWFIRCAYRRTAALLLIPVPSTLKFCTTTQLDSANRNADPVMHCR